MAYLQARKTYSRSQLIPAGRAGHALDLLLQCSTPTRSSISGISTPSLISHMSFDTLFPSPRGIHTSLCCYPSHDGTPHRASPTLVSSCARRVYHPIFGQPPSRLNTSRFASPPLRKFPKSAHGAGCADRPWNMLPRARVFSLLALHLPK